MECNKVVTAALICLFVVLGTQFNANKLQCRGGSGLGLTLTKGIAEQHGGTIRADSEGQGHGAVFTIKLPLCKGSLTSGDDATVEIGHADGSSPEEGANDKPTNRRILEDVHSSIAFAFQLALQCSPVERPISALALLRSHPLARHRMLCGAWQLAN